MSIKKIMASMSPKLILGTSLASVFLIALAIGYFNLKQGARKTSTQSMIASIQSQIAIRLKFTGDLVTLVDLQKSFSSSLDLYEDTDGSYYLGAKDNSDPSLKIDGFIDPGCRTKARTNDSIACVQLRD